MDNTGELRAATTKRDLSPIESTDCKLKVEPEANPQTSEVVEKPVASDRQGSPSVHTDSGTGDSGKQGQSSASSLSETKDTSGQKALESTTSSKQRNSDVSHGNTPRSKADEAHIQVSKAVSEFELDEGKDDSQEKPGAALQEATKKLHKKNSSPTESTDCEVKEEPKANLQTSKVAGKPVASDRQGSRSIHTDSGTKNNGNRGAENSGKQGSKVVQPPESSESETKDTSDLKALESTTSSEERNSDVSHGNFQRSDESHVQVSKAGSESKLEEEKDNSQGKPGPALQAATKKPHEKNSSPMKPTGCEVKEEPKANLQTSEVTDKPVASDRQGSPSVHTASGAENSGKQGSEVVQPPESPQSETKDTSDLKALESMKYSEEGNSDVSHGNTQRSEADEAHVPVSKAVLGADLPADHHDDTVPTTSSNKSEARTSGPNDKVEKPPSSRDSLVTKPESSDQNAQKLKKGTLSVDNDSDSSDEFKDALSGQEMLFDEHLRRLCSQCNKEQVVVVLHAFIDLKLWDVPYTLEDMKNLMAVRSSLGKWKENDAVGIDITKLESDDEDSVYRLKAVLVVHRSTLHEGFPYKYFLDRENSKAAECYEFVKIDGTKVFNRYVSEKNTWDETEVIHHHYDDFVLPKFPERTWFEKAQSKVKKWFKGDRSLRDSLRREALRLYLNEYCSQSLSFVSPVPLHTMKFFHLVDAICNIYRQLRDQCFCHHGSNQGTINRSDARLSDDLEEWIYSITDDHSATNVDINVETESHTMAVGLILLMVAHNSEMLAASSPKIAHLLDLCRKVPQVVACVGKIKEQVRHDVRGEYKVSAALKQLIRALTAPRKEPQCILGVLLFLSMWISDNDSCRLFDSTHCFSKDVLKQIRYAASDHQNSWINDYERCCRGSLTMFCPHLGEIALQISPLTTWPRLLPTNSLPQILEILSVRIEEEALTRAGLHEKTEALDQIITNIVQGMNQSREWDILDLEKMAHYIFLIVNSVLKGQYNWYVRTKTIRLCLCVYSRLSEDEDRLRLLVDRVTHAVSTATTYEFGYSNQALFLKFGSGYDAGFAFEINIWTNILSLCDESWLPLAPKWVELCLRKVLFRFQKLIFTDMLKALEVLQKTKKPSEALGKTLMDGIIEEFFSFPKERQELLIKGHYGSSSQFRSIMVEFLQRECPNPNKVDLGHLCTWRLWPCYFKVFARVQDVPHGMDPYRVAVNVMEVTVANIKDGRITKQEMDMIISNKITSSNFTEIVHILFNSNVVQEVLVGLEQLQHVYMTFNADYERIYRMLQYCEPSLNEQGKEECRRVFSIEKASLNAAVPTLRQLLEGCCPKDLFCPLLHMSDPFNLTFGKLSCGSVKKLWSKECTPCDLSFLAKTLWPCFLSGLEGLVKKYINLSIPCGVADDYLPHAEEEKDLRCMLHVLTECNISVAEREDWICEAVEKVRIYRKAKHKCKAAEALMNLKGCLGIADRFEILESLVNAASMGNEPLSSISEHMGSVVDFLCASEKNLDDLLLSSRELAKSTDLIAWIRKEVKNAGELRTFISMAQMAHCEDDSTRDCLNNLKVVMKLSPFIFQLNNNSNLQQLMECCKTVLLERLNGVPRQLRNCSQSLEKYKEVQKMLGSVEKTVYGQVKDLTISGVFTLCSPLERQIPKDIHDLVHVAVQGKNTASKQQYSLNELKDLQSKLALVRGNISDEDIKDMAEFFWKGLELTVRGADALLELLSAGHTHYKTFDFVYSLKGKFIGVQSFKSFEERVRKMERELDEWKKEIEDCRGEFYELNFFTAHQISLICEEVSQQSCQGVCKSLPMWFRNLLQCISPTIRDDIVQGILVRMIEAKEMEKNVIMFSLPMAPVDISDCSLSDSEICDALCMPSSPPAHSHQIISEEYLNEKEKQIFDALVEMEFSKNLILRGIHKVGWDFEALMNFCTDNSADDVKVLAQEEGFKGLDEESIYKAEDLCSTITAITDEGYPLDLAQEAYSIHGDDVNAALDYCMENEERHDEQKQFLESTLKRSTIAISSSLAEESTITPPPMAISEENLWSLRDVASFLKDVAEGHKGDVTHDVRTFSPKYFVSGSPNLLIVPRKNIFRVILSLYMYSEDLPLPTAEEVLYCHSKTTTEDIRLLWRRAVGDLDHRRIFCLVCEQSLSYRIAKESVQDIRKLMQGHSGFRLVIICCQEDEGSSLLIGDLREYKRSLPPLPKEEKIVKYLQEHFVPDDLDSTSARIDPDKSYVRVITSTRPGMGKSLYVQRLVESLRTKPEVHSDPLRVITLHGPDIDNDSIVRVLMSLDEDPTIPLIFHFDVSERVLEDIGAPLFNMLILHALQSSKGVIWRYRQNNLYAVEITLLTPNEDQHQQARNCSLDLIRLLPTTHCLSPKECLQSRQLQRSETLIGMDETIRTSSSYQRVFQYLSRFKTGQSVDDFVYTDLHTEGTDKEWIGVMCRYSGLVDPTWLELSHFISFLNAQLTASERSIYCDQDIVSDVSMGVTGFKSFVVKFMIKMSVDFTIPSIKSEAGLSQEDRQNGQDGWDVQDVGDDLEGYQIVKRRAWESSIHPYIFFNRDTYRLREAEEHYDSMTFVGFNLQQVGKTVNLVDLNHQVIEERIMTEGLYRWLRQSGVEVRQDPQNWNKLTILKKLCRVLESKFNFDPDQNDFYFKQIDPDPTYELTFDNLVKMLAIQMRFRCGIPVVIMGETGCGKTRLIRYMCQLQSFLAMNPDEASCDPLCQTFFIMKMHGGITEGDIVKFVSKVREDARVNQQHGFQTVVFFDEANTSDAIGLIKEIMCDRRIRGKQITEDIKFIAACNPYKKHSQEMIESLESAGLGFSVRIQETKQRLGSTPLRHLVYRVLELPASMKPLIYDYGGLTDNTEETYIGRMVQNHVQGNPQLSQVPGLAAAVAKIISWCHAYMRGRKDECSYVSLRDVERCMIVFEWFRKMYDVFAKEKDFQRLSLHRHIPQDGFSVECTMSMIVSLTVCYYARLIDRGEFETQVVGVFSSPLVLANGKETFTETIYWCQETFLSNMELGPNIAHNAALRENVFMMTICVELRIPLFLVGKPGSSKSLAKSVVATSMKAQASEKSFLKEFKSVELLSYQCSQLSTPQSIIDVFKSAKNIQEGEDCSRHVAVVVLDEVGLAEDSPSLPLKALHPLLEDGTDGSDPREIQVVKREERVGFIGISNWALDPAKMNRGIMLRRGNPDVDELVNSARGICSNDVTNPIRKYLEPMFRDLATAYLNIIKEQRKKGQRKEFFGLRDFYSLIKMLYCLVSSNTPCQLTTGQLRHAVLRNFGGIDKLRPFDFFEKFIGKHKLVDAEADDPSCDPLGLIKESLSLQDKDKQEHRHSENRYLLFLTENDAALQIMQDYLVEALKKPPYVLFGSSFPKDKDYTQVCRNINQIKICMETGRTIVLLNLDNLYESLYDLLNQYYTKSMENRYVDLGLQTHRIKCRVHDEFKLILIAEKDNVYEKFPIPLINRLEKHLVTASTIMTHEQSKICKILEEWVKKMSHVPGRHFEPGDMFVGYQSETPVAVVLQACKQVANMEIPVFDDSWNSEAVAHSMELMIKMACPDALARLKQTNLQDEAENIWAIYFKQQQHLCLSQLIHKNVHNFSDSEDTGSPQFSIPMQTTRQDSEQEADEAQMGLLIQVTTYSQPLAPVDVHRLCQTLNIDKTMLIHMYLEELDAEADFTDRMRKHLLTVTKGDAYILVQCSSGHLNKDLISCARHKAVDVLENFKKDECWKRKYRPQNRKVHIIFIVSLPKTQGGSKFIAFQGGQWMCVHLDDLRAPEQNALNFYVAVGTPLSELFYPGREGVVLHRRLESCLAATVAQLPDSLENYKDGSRENLLSSLREAVGIESSNPAEHHTQFYEALVQHIYQLIKQNEDAQLKVTKLDWAVREAMDPDRLQEGGTFLNTLLRRVDRIITDLLAYIIEFVNQHNNLRLCHSDHLNRLWVQIFENRQLCTFSYEAVVPNEDIVPPFQKQGSFSVGEYECQMPFSWIFISAVESHMTDHGSDVNSLYQAFKTTSVGDFLYAINDEELNLPQLYLKDFIAAVIQPTSEHEAKILEIHLQMESERLLVPLHSKSLLHHLLSYHVAYYSSRLQYIHYRELGRIFPALHQTLLSKVSKEEHKPLDLVAVDYILTEVTPKAVKDKEFWQLKNLREKYIKRLRDCQSTIDEVLGSSPVGTDPTRKFAWQKIRAVQMYIEHLVLPFQENDQVYKGAFRLWSILDRLSTSFSDRSCLENFKKSINSVDNNIAKSLNQQDSYSRRDALERMADDGSQGNRYAQYCQAVKMLFLEVISVLCFGSGSYGPPQADLIEDLMDIVFNQQKHRTQDLTPFEWEASDENPVIRSVLLQLIIKRDWEGFDVGTLIEDFMRRGVSVFSKESLRSSSDIYTLVVTCLEDKAHMYWKQQKECNPEQARFLERLHQKIESSLRPFTEHDPQLHSSFRWLHSVAQLRCCLSIVADILNDHVKNSPTRPALSRRGQHALSELVQLLANVLLRDEFQDLSLYLSKQIARKHGMKSLRAMFSQGLHFVLPKSLHSDDGHQTYPDLYVLCGNAYCDIRQSLVQSALDESVEAFQSVLQHIPPQDVYCVPLAIFAKTAWPVSQRKPFTEEMVLEAGVTCSRLGTLNNKLTSMCHSLLERNTGGRSSVMQPSQDFSRRTLTSLVLQTAAVILMKRNQPLLKPFTNVLEPQQGLDAEYLPTMPEDFLVEAMRVMDMQGEYRQRSNMRGKFYACPNGHPYIITECTGPNQGMLCPKCGAGIGAQRSQIASGNYQLQKVSRKETGYTLGDTASRSRDAVPERNLSPVVCAVTRFILHACFLWSSCHCSEEALVHIRNAVTVQVRDLAEFFWQHLKLDLIVIGKALSCGEDDVTFLLSAVIQAIAAHERADVDGSMASKNIRKTWENMFSRIIVDPVLGNAHGHISYAVARLTEDAAMAEDEVFLAVYEKTKMEPTLTQTLLTYRSKINVQDLTAALVRTPNGRQQHPLLYRFLNDEPLLRALQYLPGIVRLQRALISCFSHRLDHDEAGKIAIGEALKRAAAGSEEALKGLKDSLYQLRQAWSIVREKLPHHRISVPKEEVEYLADIADVHPVEYLLPGNSGPGLCSLALSDFLLFQQNELLEFCRKSLKYSGFPNKPIPMPHLQPFHMISYEEEIDSIILTHCRYSLKFGKGQDVKYDFGALEKHIYDRFLVGKPEIDGATQSVMIYSSDVIQQDVFDQLRQKIKPQDTLNQDDQKDVLRKLHGDLREISEALHILTIAISFLASKGGNKPDTSLSRYIINVLRIRKTEFCKQFTLSQVLSLWETLALQKSKLQALNGKKIPFNGFDVSMVTMFKDLNPATKKEFMKWLRGFPLDLWMTLLFKFIQLRLKSLGPGAFKWPLVDTLDGYVDRVDDNNIQDHWGNADRMPEDILVKNAVHVWHLTVHVAGSP